MSIVDLIIEYQNDYYKKHNRAVSMLILNKTNYNRLLSELEKDVIHNLHGMQLVINSKIDFKLI